MANQTNPGLVIAAETALKQTHRAIALTKLFTHNFSSKPLTPGSTVKIPVYGATAAGLYDKNTNNYGTVDDTIGYAAVEINKHRKHTFGIDQEDLNDVVAGSIWDREGEVGGAAIAKALEADVMGLFTYANAKAQVTLAASKANLAQLVATCAANDLDPRDCTVVLTPAAYATILASLDANVYGSAKGIQDGIIEGLYGFKAIAYSAVLPTASSASADKAWGVIVPTGAAAVASAPIHTSVSDSVKNFGNSTDENSGLVMTSFHFVDHDTLTTKANVVTQYGCALTYDAAKASNAPRYVQLIAS